MNFYTFHQPQGAPIEAQREDAFDDVRAIPDGLSFWAIIFPLAWLIWHKMWIELGFYLVIAALVSGLLATVYAPAAMVLSGLPGVYLWLEGHNLRREKLRRSGYRLVDVIEAKDEKTAFARFVSKAKQRSRDDLSRLKDLGMPSVDPAS